MGYSRLDHCSHSPRLTSLCAACSSPVFLPIGLNSRRSSNRARVSSILTWLSPFAFRISRSHYCSASSFLILLFSRASSFLSSLFCFSLLILSSFDFFLAMAWTSSRIVIPATIQSLIFQKAEIPPLYLAFTPPGPIPTPASILAEECVLEKLFLILIFFD